MKTSIIRIVSVSTILVLTAGCSRGIRAKEYVRTVPVMGTFLQLKILDPGLSRENAGEVIDGAIEAARELESKFSAFDPDSEVNLLNTKKTLTVSPELLDVLRRAERASRITGGAFDITVAPILKADGFYENMPAEIREKIPAGDGGVGWRNVALDTGTGKVVLRKGAWLDLSGIAKGYIVDRMAAYLKEKGLNGVMINVGGDLWCGVKPGGRPWVIGVRDPGRDKAVLSLYVKDKAVATSGDYENVVVDEKTGEVTAHIIDPFTDRALKEVLSSVTVIAPACAEADALATGMMVMGADAAIALADTMEGVFVIVIDHSGGKRTIDYSRGAREYTKKERF